MNGEINGYELSRKWFDFAFENTSRISPNHTALYFFIIEHNNRLGWRKEFGLPRDMAMDAIGIKNGRTYSKTFSDLVEFGFVKVIQESKNQYSANVIALVKNTQATTQALTQAMHKHVHKHHHEQYTGIAPIDKPLTINHRTINNKHSIDFNEIMSMFNSLNCKIPKIKKITQARKKSIQSRVKDYDLETIYEVFKKTAKSDFLNGGGKTNFVASFDWILKPSNFQKILEGNYDSKEVNLKIVVNR